MDFIISRELESLRKEASRFTKQELFPLEQLILKRELSEDGLPPDMVLGLAAESKANGLWAVDAPAEYGGQGLGLFGRCVLEEQFKYTIVPFNTSDANIDLLLECNEAQRENYLLPVVRGEKRTCFALAEPGAPEGIGGAGSDWSTITTRAERDGDSFVINGQKRFVTGVARADIAIVFARAQEGIAGLLVDRGSPGLVVGKALETMGPPGKTYEVAFEGCRVPEANILKGLGQGEALIRKHLVYRGIVTAARCLGQAQRCLDMAIDYSRQRVIGGEPLSQRQAVQWMVAESAMDIHATRVMAHAAAWRYDRGLDVRHEGSPDPIGGSVVKLFASEMACRVADRALQIHGGLGYTRELPLELIYRSVRLSRIVEGPSEVHRAAIAAHLLGRR